MSNQQSAISMLPTTLPLFPLPNVVLFPNVCLPLHIFEARYREMVSDVLDGDRIIGMVLLRPGWESDYEGRPEIYQVGCAGLITHAEKTSDGRYNLVLRGFQKFRIRQEDHQRSYRLAEVDTILEPMSEADRAVMRVERRRLETLLVPQPEGRGVDPKMPPSMPDEELVNALSQYLDLEVVEKQALLERDGLVERCRSLIDLLEMKVITARHDWGAGTH
jgi:Lon protease-like protein